MSTYERTVRKRVPTPPIPAWSVDGTSSLQQIKLPVAFFQSGAEVLIVDQSLKPLYASQAAEEILAYPERSAVSTARSRLQARLRSILVSDRVVGEPPPCDFVSGKRQYVCRPIVIRPLVEDGRPPIIVLTLERTRRDPFALSEAGRRFHLTRREVETVEQLIRGLTTKEVAERMHISPNTVKQFIRLVMGKMAVTTRSGILGRLIDKA